MDSSPDGSDEARRRKALAEAMSHPIQGRIMSVLYERPDISIRRIADRLGESPRRIRHQVEALLSTGLVDTTGEEHRRGVVERRYSTVGPNEITDPQGLSTEQQVRMASRIVKLLLDDVAVAARAGTFGRHADRCEARFYGEVDEAGQVELAAIHLRAYREVGAALEAARDRVRESGEPGTEVVSGLFFFEAPLWGSGASGSDS